MPEVYLTADGARELILTLQKQLKDALNVIDEAIALVKSRTQEADASHAVAQHNWQVANRLERDLNDWRTRAERAEAKLTVLQREVDSRAIAERGSHA